MIKVAVSDLEYGKATEVFADAAGFECLRAPTPEAELAEFIRDNKIAYVIVGVDKYHDKLYEALPQGGVIARFGVGHDGIDKALARSKGIYCTNTPGVLDNSVAECAMGLILLAARHLAACVTDNKNSVWKNRVGTEVSGKNLAIIGGGNIGCKVAKIARAGFGMQTTVFDINEPKTTDNIDKVTTDFSDAVANADFVSVHIPDIPATKDFINMERLTMMKKSAVLINTARGNVLDEDSLYDAIENRIIAGAALDVFKSEPYIPQSPSRDLRALDCVIMTPHIGSSTVDACRSMAIAALRNIRMAVAGKTTQMDLIN